MIKSLRKKHRVVWTLWAFLLPVGIVISWLIIPNQRPVTLLQQRAPLLPVVVKSKSMEDFDIVIRTDHERLLWQLEWKNKTALTVPSAVIYKVDDQTRELTQNELIGRIEARGNYVFPIKIDSWDKKRVELALYDFIHQKLIRRIHF